MLISWIGILCLAMKSCRPGELYISEEIPAGPEDISDFVDVPVATVEKALAAFEKLGMIGYANANAIAVIKFSEHQEIDKITASREAARVRMLEYRRRKNPDIKPRNPRKSKESAAVTLRERNANATRTFPKVTPLDIDIELDTEKKNGEPLSGAALLLKIIIDLRKDGAHGGIPVTPKENGKPKYTPAHARLYGKAARFKLEAIAEADGTDMAGRVFRWAAGDKFWGAQELHAGNYERYKAGYTAAENGAGEDPLIKSMKASAAILGGNDGT